MKQRHYIFSVLAAVCAANLAQEQPASLESRPDAIGIPALVGAALANNPELAFYRAEIAAAKGERRSAATLQNPEAEFELGRKRSRPSEGGLSAEGTAWGVSVSQTFEWPNRLSLRKAIANRQIELAEIGFAQFQRELANAVQRAAFRLLIAQERRDAALNVARRGEELVAALLQREPAGTSPLIESRIIEASVLTLKRRAVEAAADAESALLELNQLRGEPIGTGLRIAPVKLRFPVLDDANSFIALARTNNLEVKSRIVDFEQQGLRVDLAKNERFPNFTVRPFFSQEDADEREQVAGVGVSVPLPLWNRNKGNIEAARSRQEQAQVALAVTQRQIETQLRESLTTYELNRREIERWRSDLLTQLQEAADLADRHYRLGSLPVATYVEMQDKYLEALETVLQTQADALSAVQTIERLTGVPLGNSITTSQKETSK